MWRMARVLRRQRSTVNGPMSFPDLRSFLDQLRRDGDLVVVDAPVDADQEAAEIHRRVIAAGGPALLFTNVNGASFPLVTNLFGTARRAELAFGTRPLALIKRLVQPRRDAPAADAGQAVGRARRRVGELTRVGAEARRTSGPVTEVVDQPPAPRSPAGHHLLAGRRRPVRHAAAGLHRASRRQGATTSGCTGCRSTTRRRPACTGRSARAAASTTGRGGARRGAAGHGLPRRTAGAHPRRHRAAARERARADAGVAHRGRAAAR